MWHGSERRPTIYVVSMDVKTGFDVARPKHIAEIMGGQNVQGWITAASLREMTEVQGQTTFEKNTRCITQESVEAPRLWFKMTVQIFWNVEEEWTRNKVGIHLDTCHGGSHQICSFTG